MGVPSSKVQNKNEEIMEIHSRHDILRASGLLLSVDCAQNGLQTSALLLADLALIWLLMSNWGLFFFIFLFFYLWIALVVPGVFAVLSQSAILYAVKTPLPHDRVLFGSSFWHQRDELSQQIEPLCTVLSSHLPVKLAVCVPALAAVLLIAFHRWDQLHTSRSIWASV